jgi:hypothetical protein
MWKQFYCIADHAIAIEKGSIIVNVGWHFFTSRVCGKFINGRFNLTSDVPYSTCKWLKVGIAVGPLAILDKINLKCMLVIMIKDSI